jgi:hypothetical protein
MRTAPLAPLVHDGDGGSGERLARWATVISVAGFLALLLPAMLLYPGGTVWDRTAPGSDFWFNYLSDLQRSVALNGEPNAEGSRLAQAAMLVLAAGLAASWWLAARFSSDRPRLGLALRVSALAGVLGAFAAGLLPSDRFAEGHELAVLVGGASGLLATACAVIGIADRRSWLLTAIGSATVLVSGVDFALYVQHLGRPGAPLGALLERVSTILLLVWLCAVARHRPRRGAHFPRTSG